MNPCVLKTPARMVFSGTRKLKTSWSAPLIFVLLIMTAIWKYCSPISLFFAVPFLPFSTWWLYPLHLMLLLAKTGFQGSNLEKFQKTAFQAEKEYKKILKFGFLFKKRLRSHLKISGSSEWYLEIFCLGRGLRYLIVGWEFYFISLLWSRFWSRCLLWGVWWERKLYYAVLIYNIFKMQC